LRRAHPPRRRRDLDPTGLVPNTSQIGSRSAGAVDLGEELIQTNGSSRPPGTPVRSNPDPTLKVTIGHDTTGTVDAETWRLLDAISPRSSVGRVEKTFAERIADEGGLRTISGTAKYTWRISDTAITIIVGATFSGELDFLEEARESINRH
jgi:hypothetical protein